MKIQVKTKAKTTGTKKPTLYTHLHLSKQERPRYADSIRFPDRLSELSPANVSDLIGQYTVLLAYAQEDLAELSREMVRLDYEEKSVTARMLVQRPQLNTIPKHQREGVIETDASILIIRRQQKEAAMKKEHTAMFVARFQSFISALSRDLSRRSISDRAV